MTSSSKNFKRFCVFYPYINQGLVSGSLSVVSDIVAQKFIEDKKELDKTRSCNFFTVGYMTGILLRSWYGFLDVKIKNKKPLNNAVNKVCGKFFVL